MKSLRQCNLVKRVDVKPLGGLLLRFCDGCVQAVSQPSKCLLRLYAVFLSVVDACYDYVV